jgi:dTMP kinase
MERGKFITLEGIEGAGKSTQASYLAELITARGPAVAVTREPGGTPLAEAIRGVLLNDWPDGVPANTELLLMFAARAAHLEQKILPELKKGTWVVCDRFTDASYAYQSAGRGMPRQDIAELERLVQGSLRPDLVLVFDLPVAVGLGRAKSRGQTNRFEAENMAFFERVRQCYLERAAADVSRYAVIDASVDQDQVRLQLHIALQRLLDSA